MVSIYFFCLKRRSSLRCYTSCLYAEGDSGDADAGDGAGAEGTTPSSYPMLAWRDFFADLARCGGGDGSGPRSSGQ